MKFITFFVLGLSLFAGCAHVFTTSAPVNVDGMWQGEYDSGTGAPPMLFTFNFISGRDALKGIACVKTTAPDVCMQLENGEIKGGNIFFTTTAGAKSWLRQTKFFFEGKIKGNEIKLAFRTGIVGRPAGRSNAPAPGKTIAHGYEYSRGQMFDIGPRNYKVRSPMTRNRFSDEFTIIRVK